MYYGSDAVLNLIQLPPYNTKLLRAQVVIERLEQRGFIDFQILDGRIIGVGSTIENEDQS